MKNIFRLHPPSRSGSTGSPTHPDPPLPLSIPTRRSDPNHSSRIRARPLADRPAKAGCELGGQFGEGHQACTEGRRRAYQPQRRVQYDVDPSLELGHGLHLDIDIDTEYDRYYHSTRRHFQAARRAARPSQTEREGRVGQGRGWDGVASRSGQGRVWRSSTGREQEEGQGVERMGRALRLGLRSLNGGDRCEFPVGGLGINRAERVVSLSSRFDPDQLCKPNRHLPFPHANIL